MTWGQNYGLKVLDFVYVVILNILFDFNPKNMVIIVDPMIPSKCNAFSWLKIGYLFTACCNLNGARSSMGHHNLVDAIIAFSNWLIILGYRSLVVEGR